MIAVAVIDWARRECLVSTYALGGMNMNQTIKVSHSTELAKKKSFEGMKSMKIVHLA